jgi:hypothetical protein
MDRQDVPSPALQNPHRDADNIASLFVGAGFTPARKTERGKPDSFTGGGEPLPYTKRLIVVAFVFLFP